MPGHCYAAAKDLDSERNARCRWQVDLVGGGARNYGDDTASLRTKGMVGVLVGGGGGKAPPKLVVDGALLLPRTAMPAATPESKVPVR